MIAIKSFDEDQPCVYLVATPIGNLKEMTPRAIEILKQVDVIACEDTRNTGILLKHFQISNHLISYQNFNEESSTNGILHLLEQGKKVALVSDAGYPLISDPGQKLVSTLRNHGYPVIPVSGSSAVLNGLVASGLIVQPFLFIGFLPSTRNECLKKLREYQTYPMTLVFYEAPHRIERMLECCYEVLGDRQMCLARELTKRHEEFVRGSILEVKEYVANLKGEMVVIIEGNTTKEEISDESILNQVEQVMKQGVSRSQAVKQIAQNLGISKNKVYDLVNTKLS